MTGARSQVQRIYDRYDYIPECRETLRRYADYLDAITKELLASGAAVLGRS